MKKIIRKGCFETNSSSTHSISLAREGQEFVLDTIYPNEDGIIIVPISDYEFGWAWDKFNDAMTKLAYAIHDDVNFDMIKEVVLEQTGAEDLVINGEARYGIDHQSVGTAKEVCVDHASTRNFIFNKNSWLFTGNDNSTPIPTFYDVPEIKGGRMIMPKYKFELVIENFEETAKFKDWPDSEQISEAISALLDGALMNKDGQFLEKDDSIWFQISRPRDFYEKSYLLDQDYSNMEILFLHENDSRFRQIEEEVKIENIGDWHDKYKERTKRALEVPGLVKKVKFEIRKIE